MGTTKGLCNSKEAWNKSQWEQSRLQELLEMGAYRVFVEGVRVDDSEPTMRTRAQGLLAYMAIFAVCLAGALQLSGWAFVAGTCVLALISMSNHPIAQRSLGGGESVAATLLFSSLLNAAATSAAALMVGRAIGWMWGV